MTHWAVTVFREGEEIVTIESNCLSGREITPEDEDAIRTAANHLLAFIGEPTPTGPTERAREIGRKMQESCGIYHVSAVNEIAASLTAAEGRARRAAIEEAAVLVETHSEGHRDGERVLFIKKGPGKDAVDGTTYAAAIRALTTEARPGEGDG